MSVEARQYVQPELAAEEVDRERPAVGELQRALSDAFAAPSEARPLPLPGEPADERLVRLTSRVAGYVVLVAGVLGLAVLIFGY